MNIFCYAPVKYSILIIIEYKAVFQPNTSVFQLHFSNFLNLEVLIKSNTRKNKFVYSFGKLTIAAVYSGVW